MLFNVVNYLCAQESIWRKTNIPQIPGAMGVRPWTYHMPFTQQINVPLIQPGPVHKKPSQTRQTTIIHELHVDLSPSGKPARPAVWIQEVFGSILHFTAFTPYRFHFTALTPYRSISLRLHHIDPFHCVHTISIHFTAFSPYRPISLRLHHIDPFHCVFTI